MKIGLALIILLRGCKTRGQGFDTETEVNDNNNDEAKPEIHSVSLNFDTKYLNNATSGAVHSRRLNHLTIYYLVTSYTTLWRLKIYMNADCYTRYVYSQCDECGSLSSFEILNYLDSDGEYADTRGDQFMYSYENFYLDIPVSGKDYIFGIVACLTSDLFYCYNYDLLEKLAIKFSDSDGYRFGVISLFYFIISWAV